MNDSVAESADQNTAVQANAEVNWRDSLPEDIRGSKHLESISDVGAMAKQYIDLQSHLGNSIRIPGPDAGDEAMKAFHDKLMSKTALMPKPETPEEYGALFEMMGKPSESSAYELPEGADAYKDLKDIALNANLTGKQFNDLVSQIAETENAALEKAKIELEESRNSVKDEWGSAFDKNVGEIDALLSLTEAPEAIKEGVKAGDVNGDVLKWMHSLAKKLGSGEGVVASNDNNGSLTLTKAEASDQLRDVMNNPIYSDQSHPRYQEFQKKALHYREMGGRY